MKRIRRINGVELYDLICSHENVEKAFRNACKDHAKDKQVIEMKKNPEPYIQQVEEILKNENFHYGRFKTRNIIERGKKRHLCYSQTFPDRIIQHAVMQIVAPILLGTCTSTTYAAMEGRGTHKCSMEMRNHIYNHPEDKYYLKVDVYHYFQSVDRNILFELIKRKIKDPRTLNILHVLIFECPGERDLPIGLYISQIFSTFYLAYFDHFLKEQAWVIIGRNKTFIIFRYMDDFFVICDNKEDLHELRKLMDNVLRADYGLHLKENHRVGRIRDGLDAVGYVHYPDHVMLRKKIKISMKKTVSSIVRLSVRGQHVPKKKFHALTSYLGMAQWCDGKRLIYLNRNRVDIAIAFGVST